MKKLIFSLTFGIALAVVGVLFLGGEPKVDAVTVGCKKVKCPAPAGECASGNWPIGKKETRPAGCYPRYCYRRSCHYHRSCSGIYRRSCSPWRCYTRRVGTRCRYSRHCPRRRYRCGEDCFTRETCVPWTTWTRCCNPPRSGGGGGGGGGGCSVTAPSGASVTNLTSSSAQLNWNSGANGDKQLLRVGSGESKVNSGCPDGTGSGTGCVIKEDDLDADLEQYSTGDVLEPGTTYYWNVIEYESGSCNRDFSSTASFTSNYEPWFKATGGDVHANALLSSSRDLPDGEFNGQYIFSSKATIGGNVESEEGWLCPLYPEEDLDPAQNSGIDSPDYQTLWRRFGQGEATTYTGGTLPTGNGVYVINGNHTVSGVFNLPSNRSTVVFVDGRLTLEGEIRVPQRSSLVLIASDTIRIDKSLDGGGPADDAIQATLIAEGDINTAYNRTSASEVHRQFVTRGSLISLRGTVRLYRNLSTSENDTTPAERINLTPQHLLLSKSLLGAPTIYWREVAP